MSLKRILVADDDTSYKNSLIRALSYNYEIDSAVNAKEAMIKITQNIYSIIITDNQMGDNYIDNGIYLIEEIRKLGLRIPIFFISADINNEIKDIVQKIGANEILKKPVDIKELKEKLKEYIK